MRRLTQAWYSPTMTTWASMASRAANTLGLTPIVLAVFPAEETSLWLLFVSLASLQRLMDVGLTTTMARRISYALEHGEVSRVASLVSASHRFYLATALVSGVAAAVIGTAALVQPIDANTNSATGWTSWLVVLVSTSASMYGLRYTAHLLGAQKVALLRRWETVTGAGAVVSSAIALVVTRDFLTFVVVQQLWVIVGVIRNGLLAHGLFQQRYAQQHGVSTNKAILLELWPATWRSATGILLGAGVIRAVPLVAAQVVGGEKLTALLLILIVIDAIAMFASTPLYANIPTLSHLYAAGRLTAHLALASAQMRLSLLLYVSAVIVIGVSIPWVVTLLSPDEPFMWGELWLLFGAAFLGHRYGAMLVQVCATSDKVVWHTADGGAALIVASALAVSLAALGVYAFPLSFLLAYCGYYAIFASITAARRLGVTYFQLERTVLLPALLIYSGYVAFAILPRTE